MVRSLDEIAFIKEWGNENWQMVSDSNLYTYSNEASEYFLSSWNDAGYYSGGIEPEGDFKKRNSRSEMIIYGRLPLMITAQCIHKNTLGLYASAQGAELKDRYSVHFPVKKFLLGML